MTMPSRTETGIENSTVKKEVQYLFRGVICDFCVNTLPFHNIRIELSHQNTVPASEKTL